MASPAASLSTDLTPLNVVELLERIIKLLGERVNFLDNAPAWVWLD